MTNAAQINRLQAPPPPPLFDPESFCKDAANEYATLFCATVEFLPDGDIPADVVNMVSTRDAQNVTTKESLKHIKFSPKLAELITGEEQQTKNGKAASKRKARELCERVH